MNDEKFFWERINDQIENMEVVEFKNDFLNQRTYFDFDITFRGKLGSGTSAIKETALAKAFAESCERRFIEKKKISPFSSAAHYNKIKSRENCLLELLERDAFLSSFYSGVPFSQMEPSLLKKFSSKFEYKIINLSHYNNYFITGCFLFTEKGGVILGIGSSKVCIEYAIEKSIIESIRKKDNHIDTNSSNGPIKSFSLWACNRKLYNELSFSRSEPIKINLPSYEIISEFQKDTGLWVSYILDSDAQKLFFHSSDESKLNLNRIKLFNLNGICNTRKSLIHPIS